MAKTKCKPVRTNKKPGPKIAKVTPHTHSKPKPLSKNKCIPHSIEKQIVI